MSKEIAESSQYWKTATGEIMALADMATSHLWNTAKMLWNHLADEYDLPHTKARSNRYIDFEMMVEDDPEAVLRAVQMLMAELSGRPDKEPYMKLPQEYLRSPETFPNPATSDRKETPDVQSE